LRLQVPSLAADEAQATWKDTLGPAVAHTGAHVRVALDAFLDRIVTKALPTERGLLNLADDNVWEVLLGTWHLACSNVMVWCGGQPGDGNLEPYPEADPLTRRGWAILRFVLDTLTAQGAVAALQSHEGMQAVGLAAADRFGFAMASLYRDQLPPLGSTVVYLDDESSRQHGVATLGAVLHLPTQDAEALLLHSRTYAPLVQGTPLRGVVLAHVVLNVMVAREEGTWVTWRQTLGTEAVLRQNTALQLVPDAPAPMPAPLPCRRWPTEGFLALRSLLRQGLALAYATTGHCMGPTAGALHRFRAACAARQGAQLPDMGMASHVREACDIIRHGLCQPDNAVLFQALQAPAHAALARACTGDDAVDPVACVHQFAVEALALALTVAQAPAQAPPALPRRRGQRRGRLTATLQLPSACPEGTSWQWWLTNSWANKYLVGPAVDAAQAEADRVHGLPSAARLLSTLVTRPRCGGGSKPRVGHAAHAVLAWGYRGVHVFDLFNVTAGLAAGMDGVGWGLPAPPAAVPSCLLLPTLVLLWAAARRCRASPVFDSGAAGPGCEPAPCIMCLEAPGETLYSCPEHPVCEPCLRRVVESSVVEQCIECGTAARQSPLRVPCPVGGCGNCMQLPRMGGGTAAALRRGNPVDWSRLLPSELAQVAHAKETETSVFPAGPLPCAHCDARHAAPADDAVLQCFLCGGETCLLCHKEAHPGNVCLGPGNVSPETLLAEAKIQACPGCKTPTTKDTACNHMTCSACSQHWCWACGEPLDARDTTSHYTIASPQCLRYDEGTEEARILRRLLSSGRPQAVIARAVDLLHTTFVQTVADL
jgi:hypothetical protein